MKPVSPSRASLNQASGAEKRVFQRRRLRTQVIFEDESGEGFIYFYSTDVSLGGLFFESDVPLKIGTKVFLSFSLPDERPSIHMTGEVVRIEREKSNAHVVGIGVRFVDLDGNSKTRIEHYVTGSD